MAKSGGSAVVVALSSEIPERGRTVVKLGEHEIGIFRLEGRLHAYSNYCAHAGGPVCQGLLIERVVEVLDEEGRSLGDAFSEEDLNIVCPWHGYEYSVVSGEHPGKPDIQLRLYDVAELDGEVIVYL